MVAHHHRLLVALSTTTFTVAADWWRSIIILIWHVQRRRSKQHLTGEDQAALVCLSATATSPSPPPPSPSPPPPSPSPPSGGGPLCSTAGGAKNGMCNDGGQASVNGFCHWAQSAAARSSARVDCVPTATVVSTTTFTVAADWSVLCAQTPRREEWHVRIQAAPPPPSPTLVWRHRLHQPVSTATVALSTTTFTVAADWWRSSVLRQLSRCEEWHVQRRWSKQRNQPLSAGHRLRGLRPTLVWRRSVLICTFAPPATVAVSATATRRHRRPLHHHLHRRRRLVAVLYAQTAVPAPRMACATTVVQAA